MEYKGTLKEGEHQLTVNAWFGRVAYGHSVEALIQAFESTFAALWQRSLLTLGEVTLSAIVDRVLHTATEQHPLLASLEIASSGLRCEGVKSQVGLPHEQVSAAFRFVLVEFLTVIGNLTAQILTPALHAEMEKSHAIAGDSGATKDQVS